MNRLKTIALVAGLLMFNYLDAQVEFNAGYVHHKNGAPIHATNSKTTGKSGTGANINVIYHRCNWTADPDDATKTLIGSITTMFKTIAANTATISFDFNNNSFNNADLEVLYHGAVCNAAFATSGNFDVLNITLPNALNEGVIDSVTINYKGTPPDVNGNAEGYQRDVDGANNNYIFTLSESYEDKDWWPCKADMQDKIDSIDINVTVPAAFWVAANGVMIDSVINGTSRTFSFKHRYPIASYLVALGIAKFKRLNLGTVNIGSKNVPFFVNYFPDKTTAQQSNIDKVMNNNKLVLQTFSTLYGEYPFANEKHGYYEFGFGGGMEHQTFSGMSGGALQSNTVSAHELGHQWWGDKVTFATWNHLWLAEGFATYSEILMAEFVPSLGISHLPKLTSIKNTARNNTTSSIYLNNITNSNTVWTNSNTTAVYNRGCMVASMLRCLLGDAKFFNASRTYLSDTVLAYKSATTANLQQHMETQFGESMSGFFTEWIMKKGSPTYAVQWGNVGNKINFKLTQSVTATGTSGVAATFLPMPVVLKIADATASVDTTIVIYHRAINELLYAGNGVGALANGNVISFNLSFVPATITFDPENRTMATGTVTYSAALPIKKIDITAKTFNSSNEINVAVTTNNSIKKVILEVCIDGSNFNEVGRMQQINKKDNVYEFTLTDKTTTDKVFYRAKVVDADGSNYSKTITVSNKNTVGEALHIYPNPAATTANIEFNNLEKNKASLVIIGGDGKVVDTFFTNNSRYQLQTTKYAAGNYLIRVFMDDRTFEGKLFIVK